MDTNLLRAWLGLPPGPWPPDARTLLGLADRPVSAADAERQALTQMAKLRPHQLVHPDLVTEGMNRLAQALLTVSAAAPAAPVVPPPPAKPVVAPPKPPPPRPAPPNVAPPPPPVAPRPADHVDEGIETAYEVDDEDEDELPPGPAAPPEPRLGPVIVTSADGPADLPPVRVGPTAADRRDAYRELAGLRAVLAAWDRLRPFFADPSEAAATAGQVFDFLEAVAAARAAARHPGLGRGFVADVAPRTAAVARQPLALAVFRALTPSQRLALARDWAAGRAWFEAYAVAVRAAARRAARARSPDGPATARRVLARNPEWLTAAAAVVLALVTGAKLLLRR